MTEIVGFAGLSHSPFATLLPPERPSEPGGLTCTAGKVTVELDGVTRTMTPGSSLMMPRRVPHMFYNPFDVRVVLRGERPLPLRQQ